MEGGVANKPRSKRVTKEEEYVDIASMGGG